MKHYAIDMQFIQMNLFVRQRQQQKTRLMLLELCKIVFWLVCTWICLCICYFRSLFSDSNKKCRKYLNLKHFPFFQSVFGFLLQFFLHLSLFSTLPKWINRLNISLFAVFVIAIWFMWRLLHTNLNESYHLLRFSKLHKIQLFTFCSKEAPGSARCCYSLNSKCMFFCLIHMNKLQMILITWYHTECIVCAIYSI